MALTQLAPPYPIFTDRDGSPLDNGFLYFGFANQNPETNPIQIYWDKALTQPAAQPVRTINGYPARNGSPAAVFTNDFFSITVRNKRSELVIHAASGYGIDVDRTAVESIAAEVTIVAGIATDVTTVAGISADVTALVAGTGGNLTGNWTASGVWDFTSTEAIRVPVGTTAQRPSVPAQGDIRRNTTTGAWEGYDGISWGNLGFNPADVAADIIPDADSTRDIGSAANRWAEGWFDEVTTTDLSDGTDSVPVTTVINGSAKAWANYDGSVPSVRDSLNLSSLVDNTTGDFTANYSAAFANANYAAKGAPGRQSPTSTTAYWNFPTGSTLAYSVSATNFISGYSIGTSSGMGVLDCFITLFSCDGDLA
jgi:hypothetical protein